MKLDNVRRNYDRLARPYDFFDRWVAEPLAGMSALREQTVATLELSPGNLGSRPGDLTAVGDDVFFAAYDAVAGLSDRAALEFLVESLSVD